MGCDPDAHMDGAKEDEDMIPKSEWNSSGFVGMEICGEEKYEVVSSQLLN